MRINLTGINHQTAPVAVREKIAVSSGKLEAALAAMKIRHPRGIILSTCNRTEIYTAGPDGNGQNPRPDLECIQPELNRTELSGCGYTLNDKAAVEHLYRVAAGLDSMIVGEYEVLGQVSNALKAAETAGTVHLPLRQLFQSAIRAGRRVREETGISRNAVSVSSAAVALSLKSVKNHDCKMLVIGTGEAGVLVAETAKKRGVPRITVIGRTEEKARPLAQRLGGAAAGMETLEKELADADIVISCSGAPHHTLTLGQVKQAVLARQDKPLFIMDIAVPRNIEPAVSRIAGVSLYNIDDINRISRRNLERRKGEIDKAERILAEELESFDIWRQEYEARPVIKAMVRKAEIIRRSQLQTAFHKLPDLTKEEKHRLDMMTKAMIKKILGDPIASLKTNGHDGRYHAEAVKQLFRLEVQEPE